MKLDEFVRETLASLVDGVLQDQEAVAESGGRVNPTRRPSDPVQEVQFDVELATLDGSKTGGKLGIFVGPIGVGTEGSSASSSRSVGRIRFAIPVELPSQAKPRRSDSSSEDTT